MKIESSTVFMNSESMRKKVSNTTEQLKVWVGNQPGTQNSSENLSNQGSLSSKEIFEKLKSYLSKEPLSASLAVDPCESEEISMSDADEAKITLLNKLIEALTGKRLRFYIPKRITTKQAVAPTSAPVANLQAVQGQQGAVRFGWGFDYQRQESYSEQETMSFQSGGIIKTSDGRSIQFDVQLNLSRSFVSESNISMKGGDALIDPLVINYDQPSAVLTQNKFSFDLDLDGKADNISFAKTGSGFLAYDKNGDGIINNGSELFGPKTGDGFLELSEFDSDGNNWIDENDSVYDKLQIWTKDENGKDQLFAIGEKGIGAIYLGSVNSLYSLNDTSNTTQGQIKQTGIFLREDGSAGTIQHVDISL